METFSVLLALCEGNHRSPVHSPHKSQWRWVLMFSLICSWINVWANHNDAGDLRRHRTHYDVTIMTFDNAVCWGWHYVILSCPTVGCYEVLVETYRIMSKFYIAGVLLPVIWVFLCCFRKRHAYIDAVYELSHLWNAMATYVTFVPINQTAFLSKHIA